MSTQRRMGSSSNLATKRHAMSSENAVAGKTAMNAAKKRPPLGNLTNRDRPSSMVPCSKAADALKTKKGFLTKVATADLSLKSDEKLPSIAVVSDPCPDMEISPASSPSTRHCSLIDENDEAAANSIESGRTDNLCVTEQIGTEGNADVKVVSEIKLDHNVANVDDDLEDPQMCATFACDIYEHLRASEMKKRPSTDFIERIQQDINANMRSVLIDWLVEVAEEYRLVPDTLYLTVNYIDRFLSGNSVNRQNLQLLGVACMMIATKYEEICAPQVEEFCYITDNTYLKEEVLEMESSVLNYLKFEMTAITTKCFLRRFIRAAQMSSEASPLQLEFLANYLAELSLLEYDMLQFVPSVTAASAIFLAKYILVPSGRPWNTTLQHYTLYEPSDIRDCVRALHKLCLSSHNSSLPAIRDKYSQHKYKYVAKKSCPATIPTDYFNNICIT